MTPKAAGVFALFRARNCRVRHRKKSSSTANRCRLTRWGNPVRLIDVSEGKMVIRLQKDIMMIDPDEHVDSALVEWLIVHEGQVFRLRKNKRGAWIFQT